MNRILHFVLAVLFCLAIQPLCASETLPLAGQWRFALDRHDTGTAEKWFTHDLPASDKIQLPGILEAQGYGDEISTTTPWVLSLYDHFWYLRADYAADTNAGSVKVPFLCQPPRHYLGAAWYHRDVDVPANWSGRHVSLFLERPHWKSTVWLDDREIGSDLSLCAPHEYDLGLVPPGRHRLTIRVDNRMQLPYRPDAHSVSDSLDDAWNGIVGTLELRSTPPVWVDQVQIYPDAKTRSIKLHAVLHFLTNELAAGKVSYFIQSQGTTPPLNLLPSSINFNTSVLDTCPLDEVFQLGDQARLWDEFDPALYALRINVAGAVGSQPFDENVTTVFGLRDFHAAGNQFILNGHPMYFRGTHFGGDFPLTGYPPTDVESWKKIFQTCKDYGLNHMRFHSWCPPGAAFEAADQLGFYLQVECGMWNAFTPGGDMEKQLYSETERILRAYGNHPSLMLISASNEAAGRWKQVLPDWVKHFRAEDSRHLYTPDTGWALIDSPDQPLDGSADYLAIGRVGMNRVRGESGWFGGDYASSIAGVNVPVIGHEVGQWCAYPDFEVIPKFTGFMRPGNFEIFRDSAAAHGVLDRNKEYAHASGRFQLECYQEEIEANLRTPGLDGFQLLDLHDYTGQGTALVGLLDPFWESKGYVTPEEFRQFCGPVVPLAWFKQRVLTTAEKLDAQIGVANFGPAALHQADVHWEIRDARGKTMALCPSSLLGDVPVGFKGRRLSFTADLEKFPAPARYQLAAVVNATGQHFENHWNFWLYPAQIPDTTPANVLVTRSWDDAAARLAAGGKVLFLPHNADLDWNSPPLARVPIFWNALMGPTWGRMLGLWCETASPALAEFPTDASCDWQWTELLRNTRAVNLGSLPRALQPIVAAIDDWNRNDKLGVIFEAGVGPGKLLVCSIDLDGNPSPVAQQLRRSLLDYLAGNKFQPAVQISPADFDTLYFDTRIMHKLGANAQADGHEARELVDGDPNTFWSSANARGQGSKPPHEIELSFPQSVAMNGLVLMPRQNQREHQGDIHDYTVATSDDGTNWQAQAAGQLASTFDEQRITFGKTVSARFVKLTALSGFGTDTSAALAEVAVLYAGPKLSGGTPDNLEYKSVKTASPDIDAGTEAPARH